MRGNILVFDESTPYDCMLHSLIQHDGEGYVVCLDDADRVLARYPKLMTYLQGTENLSYLLVGRNHLELPPQLVTELSIVCNSDHIQIVPTSELESI